MAGTNLIRCILNEFSSLQRQGQTIYFMLNDAIYPQALNWLEWADETQPGFYALADADSVYAILQDLLKRTKAKNDWT